MCRVRVFGAGGVCVPPAGIVSGECGKRPVGSPESHSEEGVEFWSVTRCLWWSECVVVHVRARSVIVRLDSEQRKRGASPGIRVGVGAGRDAGSSSEWIMITAVSAGGSDGG